MTNSLHLIIYIYKRRKRTTDDGRRMTMGKEERGILMEAKGDR